MFTAGKTLEDVCEYPDVGLVLADVFLLVVQLLIHISSEVV